MLIDQATRANLELTRTLGGERRGSLLDAIDRTVTSAGSRLLAQRLAAPLTDPAAIAVRLDAVAAFVDDPLLRADLRDKLKAAPDLARAFSRIVLARGGPRDLAAIRDGAAPRPRHSARPLADAQGHSGGTRARPLQTCSAPDAALAAMLSAALADELPPSSATAASCAKATSPRSTRRALRDESRRVVAALQARYADETGVRSLKIQHNNVLGYFVEVTAQHGEKLLTAPLNAPFIHRQTLAGQVRFTTTELGELEAKIASAADRALGLELEIFERLCDAVIAARRADQARGGRRSPCSTCRLRSRARRGTPLCAAGDRPLARFRHRGRTSSGRRAGADATADPSSPTIATSRRPQNGKSGRIWLLTGPNMAGKSTFLRQNALIAILAQMGSFVPAKSAHIGVVDRLFSRVGAADDLARGRSTFMVEMVETAAILNQAGERALVILDEIGRGTATFDGLSIAWATIEHLHEVNRCRALFATHFHELTALAAKLPRLHNATVRVKEWQGDVVFLHEVVPGAADRSYGIQVAKLAGLPPAVIERAKVVLAEAGSRKTAPHLCAASRTCRCFPPRGAGGYANA